MIGIVLPGGRTGLSRVHEKLLDKNYLTPLEIAAILDNQLVEINKEAAVELLHSLGVTDVSIESSPTLREALRLATISRG